MFFSPLDKETAIGMHTPLYFIILSFYIVLIVVSLIMSKKMNHKHVLLMINIACVFCWVTEIVKMIFYGISYGIDEIEFLPLYYCSMFMYATLLVNFKSKHIKNAGLSYLAFGGVTGAIFFFAYPSSVIPNYHALHFMSVRTMIFHSLMVYIGVLILMTGFYKPKLKHFINYSIFFGVVFIFAYINNQITGDNLMYISKPLNIAFVKKIYNLVPNLYPFLAGVLNMLVPYGISYATYEIIIKINSNKNKLIYSS